MPDEQGAMAGFENASKVLNAFNELAGAVGSVHDLVGLFSGEADGMSQIVDTLKALTSVVAQGFADLKNVVGDVEGMAEWGKVATMLVDWQQRINQRSSELKSVDASLTMNYGEKKPVASWCEGTSDDGVLHDMVSVLMEMKAKLTAGGGPGAPSPLDLWERLTKSGTISRVVGIKGETLYSQLIAWQQSMFATIQSAAYIYNAAFAYYRQTASPKPQYIPLDAVLAALGNTSDSETTWGIIEAKLAGYRLTDESDDRTVCSLPSYADVNPPQPNQFAFHPEDWLENPGFPTRRWHYGTAIFLLGETTTTGNSYVTGLNLAHLTVGDERAWFLQGRVATIGTDGKRSFESHVSGLNDVIAKGQLPPDEAIWRPDENLRYQFYGDYIRDLPPAPDGSLVVTGFKLEKFGDALVIALQYSVLQVAADGTETVVRPDPSFLHPRSSVYWWWDKGEIGWVDMETAGTTSNLPLTNATFQHVDDGTGVEHLTIRARCAWTGYQADAFQPSHLVRFSPKSGAAAAVPKAHIPA